MNQNIRGNTLISRILVVHDHFLVPGGAEKLVMTLVSGLVEHGYQVDIWTMLVDPRHFPDLARSRQVKVASLHVGRPIVNNLKTLLGFLFTEAPKLEYDAVLFSGIYAPLAVNRIRARHAIYYCHTPPRFVYDLRDYYWQEMPRLMRPFHWTAIQAMRYLYPKALAHMDKVVANSGNVAQRLNKYLGLDPLVVYPPIDTRGFYWQKPKGYYLSLSRLEHYKRVDLVIEAFRRMPDRNLIVASSGSDEQRLRELAAGADNIRFMGWVTEEEKRDLLAGCIATLYLAKDEDFGMTPVESMAAGKPVIGVAEGGLMETITPETGILLSPEPSVQEIMEAVSELRVERAVEMRENCINRASCFGRCIMILSMMSLLHQ